jgi:hypothetical protein
VKNKTPEQLKTIFQSLCKKADRARIADEKFQNAFYKLKDDSPEVWAAMCEQEGMNPDSDPGDWKC